MVEKLLSIGFQPSQIDKCIFNKGDIIFIVYIVHSIFLGNNDKQLSDIIQEIKLSGLDVDKGHPMDYVGLNISKTNDDYYQFSQRMLIDNIIEDDDLSDIYTKPILAKSSFMLNAFKDSHDFNLNLTQATRPYIMYAVHQVTKYSSCPKQEHREAILYLVQYLKRTLDIGLKFKPHRSKGV